MKMVPKFVPQLRTGESPGKALLRFGAEPGAPVTGVAFWAPWLPQESAV